ncbi:Capsid vertex component 1 [Cacatuid alphaherpesvirus 2]|uniref:Capsid vertex component 1 n=1 Tax=Cacatuid alphaherpesvirus 2 TaxID=2604840 RepID=A0A5B9R013_9ALPH|nr:Capsid vertex component 1 [Cacatuid alphaherpesvirus 2]QEG54052.1 Capsid vertex component 1 [Cacatuid alphaherpesvirus 2]
MEAHFTADAIKSAIFGDEIGGLAPFMSHLVLSESCLAGFGIPTFLLAGENNFYTEIQVRFHGCLRCTRWQRVLSLYAPTRALDKILLPDLNGERDSPFKITYTSANSWGGLFISIPVFCDPERLTFDSFTTVAIRVAICGAPEEFYEMLFTYDEVAQPQTRFFADFGRAEALALQLYEAPIPTRWSSCRKEEFLKIREKLKTLLAKRGKNQTFKKTLDASNYITHDGPLITDPPSEAIISSETNIRETDKAIRNLKAAAEKVINGKDRISCVTTSGAVRDTSPINATRDTLKAVASGLGSIVRGLGGNPLTTSQLADSRYADSLLSGLEPPGHSRGKQKAQKQCPDLEGVIMASDAEHEQRSTATRKQSPSSVEGCLRALCSILSDWGGSVSLQSPWVFSPISVTSYSCYNSGSPLLIVSYSPENTKARPPITPGLNILSEILLNSEAENPVDLSEKDKETLLNDAPCFLCPMKTRAAMEYQKLFSVDSEQMFLFGLQARVTAALITAITVAVARETETDTVRLRQILSYDIEFDTKQVPVNCHNPTPGILDSSGCEPWPARLAKTVTTLIAGLCVILQTENFTTFARGGVWKAVLNMLISNSPKPRLPFLAPFHLDNDIYLFDYFRFGAGNVTRVTGEPNVVRVKQSRRANMLECEFISSSASPAHPWAVHKFLPGQFHSYLCIGFNADLDGFLIFPGGFGLRLNLRETLNEVWDKQLNSFVLDRYSRPLDNQHFSANSTSATTCACPCLISVRDAQKEF